MIGRTIGSYRVESLLGSGGMGAVYRGLDLMLERPVAIKVLRSDVATQPHVVERFKQEARTVARLLHPNIATLYALVPDGGDLCMVMEFCEGETFEALLARRGRLDPAEVLPLFGQALDGIGHAHARGIVHRDIKPANLIRSPGGTVKVMDFGIARLLGSSRLTQTRHTVGTAEYMAPEQVRAQEVDGRSDVYALGVLLYELLTGRVPFQSDSFFEVMQAHLTEKPPHPRQFAPTLPEPLVDVVSRAMAKRPEDRFASASDLRDALDAAVHPTLETRTPARATIVAPVPEEHGSTEAREHDNAGAPESGSTGEREHEATPAEAPPTLPVVAASATPYIPPVLEDEPAEPTPTRRARKTRIASRRSSGSTAALPPAGPTAFAPTPAGPTAFAPTPEAEPPTVPFPMRAPATRLATPPVGVAEPADGATDARPAWWTKTTNRIGLAVAAALLLAVGVWSTASGPDDGPSTTSTEDGADASSTPRPAGGRLDPAVGALGPLATAPPVGDPSAPSVLAPAGSAPAARAPVAVAPPPAPAQSAPAQSAPVQARPAPAPSREAPATRPRESRSPPAETIQSEIGGDPEPAPAPAAPVSALVTITSSVSGDVYLDGQATGRQTLTDLRIPNGTHTVEVRQQYYASTPQQVTVRDGRASRTELFFRLTWEGP